ncbi:hypothetical protein V6Z11_D02G005300 [Gossypium hirsutum]
MELKGVVLMGRYEIGRLLGQGTFAKVHRARNLETGMNVAIKIVDKEKVLKVGMIDQIKREISVMRLVRHPNVIELYEVMATKTKIYFVMEYAKGGELFNKVVKGKLKEDAARKYFQQLISAVDFCHSRGVCHRDLKPENLLLDENCNLKVTDFGLSALAESKQQDGLLHTTCGTPAYVAPEVINRRGYDGCKADIWSCGVILYVLLAGYLPFQDSNLMEMYRKIGKGFDLSGLFREQEQKKEVRFTSNKTASTIISKLEDVAKRLRLKIKKKGGGLMKMEGCQEGRKGVLGIDAEIFEITPFFHLVEVKKSNGDTLEYQKVMQQDIRPALSDIVWAWQGEPLPQQLPPPPPTEEQHHESQPFHVVSTQSS